MHRAMDSNILSQISLDSMHSPAYDICMDRFSEQSPADLQRSYSFYRDREHEYDEDGVVVGNVPAYEPAEFEPPEEPLCVVARGIAADHFGTVRQYSEALTEHKRICPFCRRIAGRKLVASEVRTPKSEEKSA